jgi:hypothetical protein
VKLHWFLVALKQKQIFFALRIACPAVLSLRAWKLLANAIIFRNNSKFSKLEISKLEISKIILFPYHKKKTPQPN